MARAADQDGRTLWRWVNLPAIGLIWAYRFTLSPVLGGHCRFMPTCSRYALEAYRTRNPFTASYLVLWRLLRCHPLGGSGYDPVPEKKGKSGCAIVSDEDRNDDIS